METRGGSRLTERETSGNVTADLTLNKLYLWMLPCVSLRLLLAAVVDVLVGKQLFDALWPRTKC